MSTACILYKVLKNVPMSCQRCNFKSFFLFSGGHMAVSINDANIQNDHLDVLLGPLIVAT